MVRYCLYFTKKKPNNIKTINDTDQQLFFFTITIEHFKRSSNCLK